MMHVSRRSLAVGVSVVLLIGIMPLSAACAQTPSQTPAQKQQLDSELKAIDAAIAEAEAETAKYSGGLVKSLTDLRIATLKQTRGMVAQRANASTYNVTLRYTVDGKPFALPPDAATDLAAIDREIAQTKQQVETQQAEADRYSGGLVQAMSLATVATTRQTLAMLEQKRLALKYGLPQFIGFASMLEHAQTPPRLPHLSRLRTSLTSLKSIHASPSRMTRGGNSHGS
jgi:hypothetical protein